MFAFEQLCQLRFDTLAVGLIMRQALLDKFHDQAVALRAHQIP